MFKTELLSQILNAQESQLKHIDTEQLRTILGAFRYYVRFLEREINRRCADQPLGGISTVVTQKKVIKKKKTGARK